MLLGKIPSVKECNKVIISMKSNKSPGYDGLPVEYYKFFWDHIRDLYMKFANLNENCNIVSYP